jgi:hypothetical protein
MDPGQRGGQGARQTDHRLCNQTRLSNQSKRPGEKTKTTHSVISITFTVLKHAFLSIFYFVFYRDSVVGAWTSFLSNTTFRDFFPAL